MKIDYVDLGAQYQEHRQEILDRLDAVMASGQYILGEELETFEKAFAKLCGVKHAIGVADGTAALILSMKALGLGEGDEVITVPNSWVSSASSIALAGATPRFVDVGEDQNMDPLQLEKAITPRTKAIMPVHLTGRPADMEPILALAKTRGLYVIEDAAQSVGASYQGKITGSLGHLGCFSLHPLKNLNGAGDGGIITTNDDNLAASLLLLRNHGIKSRSEIVHWGFNSRLDCLQAAILNAKFPYLHDITEKRRANARYYTQRLSKIVQCPPMDGKSRDVFHLYVIQADRRDELQAHLKELDIGTAIHYPRPLHLQPCAKGLGYGLGDFPVTEAQSKRILSLPVHQNLTAAQRARVCDAIEAFYQ